MKLSEEWKVLGWVPPQDTARKCVQDYVNWLCTASWLELARTLVVVWFVAQYLQVLETTVLNYGIRGAIWHAYRRVAGSAVRVFLNLPGIRGTVNKQVAKTLADVDASLIERGPQFPENVTLPASGISDAKNVLELVSRLQTMKRSAWEKGRLSGAVYHGGTDLLDLQTQVYGLCAVANQLHPDCFPDVRRMEAEVVAMVLDLFHGPSGSCATSTSGGTESLLLTSLAAREWGRATGRLAPGSIAEIVAPVTVHAGINKAAHYFGMRLVSVPLDPNTMQVDTAIVRRVVGPNTVLIVGSAPNFPHGIIDDIEELGTIAHEAGVLLHVDACLGSFVVPFLNEIQGTNAQVFDFQIPGVTSISCDTHKYGFAPKGSSIIMYRSADLRRYQYTVCTDWAGGLYATPTLAGSRPGALMAGCWATLMYIGKDGYRESARRILSAASKFRRAVDTDPTLSSVLNVVGNPRGPVVAFTSNKINIYDLGDRMSKRGWHLSSLQNPPAIHMAFTRLTLEVVDELIETLTTETAELIASGSQVAGGGTSALYGVAGSVRTTGVADRLAEGFVDSLYKM